jgi:hypothetical protein
MRHLPQRQFHHKNVNYCRSWPDHATIAPLLPLVAYRIFNADITDKPFILIPREVSGP